MASYFEAAFHFQLVLAGCSIVRELLQVGVARALFVIVNGAY